MPAGGAYNDPALTGNCWRTAAVRGTLRRSRRAIVKELKDIEAGENLTLELVPQGTLTEPAAMPLINGIEIIRQ
jgi:hypothetical protein